MSRPSAIVLATSAAAIFALFAGFFSLRRTPPSAVTPPASTRLAQPAARESTARIELSRAGSPAPAAPLVTASSTPREATPADEAALMETLRAARKSDPELTLQLARDGNARFQDSPDAAERAWFVVRALADLGRHDEANVEGRALVKKYRGSRWAEDVYRHLFVNPSTHPSERGYGKRLESDP